MDRRWGGRIMLMCEDIAMIHSWHVGDLPLMVTSHTMGLVAICDILWI